MQGKPRFIGNILQDIVVYKLLITINGVKENA